MRVDIRTKANEFELLSFFLSSVSAPTSVSCSLILVVSSVLILLTSPSNLAISVLRIFLSSFKSLILFLWERVGGWIASKSVCSLSLRSNFSLLVLISVSTSAILIL